MNKLSSRLEDPISKYVSDGNLANIWLVAYCDRRLKKRDLMDINLQDGIKEIIQKISEEWVPLRISCALLTGIVKVYHHKVEFLDIKCSDVLSKMQNFHSDHNSLTKMASQPATKKGNNNFNNLVSQEDINKTLDIINSQNTNLLDILPLSNSGEHARIIPKSEDSQLSQSQISLHTIEPIIFDMEFEDFINNGCETINVEVDNTISESLQMLDDVEKRRGDMTNPMDIIAKGLEEIDSTQRTKLDNPDIDLSSSALNSPEFSRINVRSSFGTLENSTPNTRYQSIGGLSETFEAQNDSTTNYFEMGISQINQIPKVYSNNDCIDNVQVIKVAKETSLVKTFSLKRRRKILDLPLDKDLQLSNKELKVDISYISSVEKIKNFYKGTSSSLLFTNQINNLQTLPLLTFLSGSSRKRKSIQVNSVDSDTNTWNYERSYAKSVEDDTFEQNGYNSCFLKSTDKAEYSEIEKENDAEFQAIPLTPVRSKYQNDDFELIYTPWTKYGSQGRGYYDVSPLFNKSGQEEVNLLSSRAAKTMHFLNTKFSESSTLSLHELVGNKPASVVAPIFVELLHLKSKSFIDIKQDIPYGEILIFPSK
ncbi:uncharacterized protein CMU_006610 [Cryptosporidium muris RN66]|uniref:Rad21/Rec8-like protein N-terminal domain-containing protein n=1 Tax=Cryptosporidium muris (strain RN66) TaxID=441375 RepID=B6AHP3_CRYMR|nr:uncharacterized protein CMU_006610 [Cryptosporidium muris RN66]EEA07738.1 hypothetical protein, conserved [Cryptosporidium muris RN66]|eukprot:XP_002142087.1 hypothetical protein [Cryptosporidium muris RN66]